MKKAEIEQYCTDLVKPIIEKGNYDLWDVEYVREGADYYLRVYADKEGGITIDDCVLISRALEENLDAEDKIKEAYILEVSSPGLTRPLKKENDFLRSIGRLVDVKLYQAKGGKKEITGILTAYEENAIVIDIDDESLQIERKDISMVRLAFEE